MSEIVTIAGFTIDPEVVLQKSGSHLDISYVDIVYDRKNADDVEKILEIGE